MYAVGPLPLGRDKSDLESSGGFLGVKNRYPVATTDRFESKNQPANHHHHQKIENQCG